MYRCNDNVSTQTTRDSHEEDHDSKPSLLHKIADKLHLYSSHKMDEQDSAKDDTADSLKPEHTTNQTSHHDNDPVHNQAQPGVTHKTVGTLGGCQADDHTNNTDLHTGNVGDSLTALGYPVGDVGSYQIRPFEHRDNDPNHARHNASGSPGFTDKGKVGVHSNDKFVDDRKSTEDGNLFGATTNPHGHDHDNLGAVNTTSADFAARQAHSSGLTNDHHQTAQEANLFGAPSSNPHSLGHDNLGTVNTTSADFDADLANSSGQSDTPSFTDKIKSKLGIHTGEKSSDYQETTEGTNMFGLPPSNPHSQANSSSVLSQSTPQAEAGSIYSSSLLDNNSGGAMTGDSNRQGYSNTTVRDTGRSGPTNQK